MFVENINPKDFGFGKIFSDVKISSYSWDEYEEPNKNDIFDIIDSVCRNKNIYLLVSYFLSYPLDFKTKVKGNWYILKEKYKISYEEALEKLLDDISAMKFYGSCRINISNQVIDLLIDIGNSCFLIVTDDEYKLEELVDRFIISSSNNIRESFENTVNYFVSKDNTIVSVINGSGSSSINVFSMK